MRRSSYNGRSGQEAKQRRRDLIMPSMGAPLPTGILSFEQVRIHSLTHSRFLSIYLILISWAIESYTLLYYSVIGLRSGFVPGIYMAQQASYSHGYMHVGQSGIPGVCRFYLFLLSTHPSDRKWMFSILLYLSLILIFCC